MVIFMTLKEFWNKILKYFSLEEIRKSFESLDCYDGFERSNEWV